MEFDLSREWLATNGIGGFASSTIVGCNTRRYHALLCAATQPPLGRQVLVNKADETLTVGERSFDLGCNQYPGAIHPAGFQFLSEFHLDPLPRWIYRVPGGAPGSPPGSSLVVLERTLWMPHGENRTIVLYRLLEGRACTLSAHPFVTGRDYHGTHRYNPDFDTRCERRDEARGDTRENSQRRSNERHGSQRRNNHSGNSESRNSESRNSESRNSESRNSESRNSESRNSESRDAPLLEDNAIEVDSGRAFRLATHITLKPYAACPPIVFSHDGEWHQGGAWYHSFELAVERERGLDFVEDAYCPGAWVWNLSAQQPTALFVIATQPSDLQQAAQSQQIEIERLNQLQRPFAAHMSTHAAASTVANTAAIANTAAAPASDSQNLAASTSKIASLPAHSSSEVSTSEVLTSDEVLTSEIAESNPAESFAQRLALAADQFVARRAASQNVASQNAASQNAASQNAAVSDAIAGGADEEDEAVNDNAAITSGAASGEGLHTVLAGYPWFSDWGRDTMIALPGLCLATGRYDIARSILMTFAGAVSQGMIPNRFPDAGDAPDYNTVDATLWFFHAAAQTVGASGDDSILRDGLYEVLRDCIAWHIKGTRYGIKADPSDGLLRAGAAGTQLTWMDAKMDGQVFTPRAGKPVEIQALWFNALKTMAAFARIMHDDATHDVCADWHGRIEQSFAPLFWNEAENALFDFVDGQDAHLYRDGAIRPNQIFAVSLPHRLLPLEMELSVVATVERELLTPLGLRSLSPRDSRYCGTYIGDQWHRDGAYHQGTVWAWLIGPFLSAYLKVNNHSGQSKTQARQWLEPLRAHLDQACVGSISEIFDGDAPHAPRGCFAQAWSVGEVLRVLNEL